MRPGGAMFNNSMLRVIHKHNYQCAIASYYPFDQTVALPALNARHALANVRPGAIFVLHDGKGRGKRTASALEKILPEMTRRGYRIVTLSELSRAGER